MQNPAALLEQKKKVESLVSRRNLRRIMEGFVSYMIPHRSNITSVLTVGGGSYTDGQKVVVGIPEWVWDLSEEEIFLTVRALSIHECQHVNSSSFSGYQKYHQDMLAYFKGKYPKMPKGYIQTAAQFVGNGTEDGRIEQIAANYRPGTIRPVKFFRGIWWKHQPCQGMNEFGDFLFAIVTLATMGLYPKDWSTHYAGSRAEDEIEAIKPLIKKSVNAETSRDQLQVCREIMYAIEPYLVDLYEEMAEEAEAFANQDHSDMDDYTSDEERETGNGNGNKGRSTHYRDLEEDEAEEGEGDGQDGDEGEPSNGKKSKSRSKAKPSEDEGEEGEGSSAGDDSDEKDEDEDNKEDGQGSSASKDDEEESEDGSDGTGDPDEEDSDEEGDQAGDEEGDQAGDEDEESEDETSGSAGEDDEDDSDEETDGTSKDDVDEDSEEADSEEDSDTDDKGDDEDSDEEDSDADAEEGDAKRQSDEDLVDAELDADEAALFEDAQRQMEKMMRQVREEKAAENDPHKLDDKVEKEVIHRAFGEAGVRIGFRKLLHPYHNQHQASMEMKRDAKRLRKDIEQIFKNKQSYNLHNQKRGILDPAGLYRVGMKETNVFLKPGHEDTTDYAAYLLWDGSGSMDGRCGGGFASGSKYKVSAEAIGMVEEALKGLIPFKVMQFNTSMGGNEVLHHVVKDFHHENYTWNRTWTHVHQVKTSGGNMDGTAIRIATEELLARPEKERLLVVFSDGMPSLYPSEKIARDHVSKAVKEARKKGIRVISVLFGSESTRIQLGNQFKDMYQKNIILTDGQELGRHLARSIKNLIK